MAHSIELLLDQRADTTVRQMWRGLADAGLPSQLKVTSDTNRPHITLIAAERIAPDVDDRLAELGDHFPLPAVIGAPLIFGGGRMTLARLVVPSSALLALHEQVYDQCRRSVSNVFAHSAPGRWTPHVTLGRRFTPAQIGEAMATSHEIAAPCAVTITGLRRWDGDARVEHVLMS
ncbi:2'-5' RNA ligase family protein [Mycobacterium sp. CVI_P3]|uniref:2'-5' RNA ligase family protein n=1 Tax=Mycobacterium pinniadriaticum TaxID=2994102 RepID=A0ABT3SBA4_9MYCO|nr:2'-5' RNA ligase family protein [Mycobacterium pinniadriaticum]MCX2930168.1 2'-5' RNA ligase family protein [Mycobacterium pinniadriaticum]MCX2936770.1 2'-5' RNA ligase family protein [Mycobacterium pinniadriaticum]